MSYTLNRPKIAKQVLAHLKTMKHRSGKQHPDFEQPFMCQYRTRGGEKCAIGALMPDWIYSKDMEDVSINDLLRGTAGALLWPEFEVFLAETYGNGGPLSAQDLRFLGTLQEIHDNELNWEAKGFTKQAVYKVKQLAGMVL